MTKKPGLGQATQSLLEASKRLNEGRGKSLNRPTETGFVEKIENICAPYLKKLEREKKQFESRRYEVTSSFLQKGRNVLWKTLHPVEAKKHRKSALEYARNIANRAVYVAEATIEHPYRKQLDEIKEKITAIKNIEKKAREVKLSDKATLDAFGDYCRTQKRHLERHRGGKYTGEIFKQIDKVLRLFGLSLVTGYRVSNRLFKVIPDAPDQLKKSPKRPQPRRHRGRG